MERPQQGIPAVRVRSLQVRDIGCFSDLELQFSSRFNLICGANGVGKSTILAIIGRAFSRHASSLRRRSAAKDAGSWSVGLLLNGIESNAVGSSQGLLPSEHDSASNEAAAYSQHVLYFRTTRDFLYSRLDAIGRDPESDLNHWSHSANAGIDQADIKRWLANRFLFSTHHNSLSLIELDDFEFAKECFSILDPRVTFDGVEASTFDVFVATPQGRIPYEYLSSGFRAALAMLLGIVREIEVRRLDTRARDFDGLVLIDELDLHLHPTWQREIVRAIKDAFPLAQFVVTTHSPHMIQAADRDEVIALITDGGSNPRVAEFKLSQFGFKGWTIEEILQDVMGLPYVASAEYRRAIEGFDAAIDQNNPNALRMWLAQLESMLHPRNTLRKLLRLQAVPFEGDESDKAN